MLCGFGLQHSDHMLDLQMWTAGGSRMVGTRGVQSSIGVWNSSGVQNSSGDQRGPEEHQRCKGRAADTVCLYEVESISARLKSGVNSRGGGCLGVQSNTRHRERLAAHAMSYRMSLKRSQHRLCGPQRGFCLSAWVVVACTGSCTGLALHAKTTRHPAQLLHANYHIRTVHTPGCVCLPSPVCMLNPSPCRPNVAAINLCPKFFALGEPLGSKQVSALVHEMIHGLVSRHAGQPHVDACLQPHAALSHSRCLQDSCN
jgi:hypothetical protein